MADMINLRRGPVHRIVATEEEAKVLMAQGYVKTDENGAPIKKATEADKLQEMQKQVDELTQANADLTKQVGELTKANADLQKQLDAVKPAAEAPATPKATTQKTGGK